MEGSVGNNTETAENPWALSQSAHFEIAVRLRLNTQRRKPETQQEGGN